MPTIWPGNLRGDIDKESFEQLSGMLASHHWAQAYIAPRGVGPTAWGQSERKQTQNRRRFMLRGQTLDGMRIWDIHRGALSLRRIDSLAKTPLWMQGELTMAGLALYASLVTPNVKRLDLWQMPQTHQEGPILLNVLRYFDLPQTVAMATERSQVRLYQEGTLGWEFPVGVSRNLSWDPKQLQIRALPDSGSR